MPKNDHLFEEYAPVEIDHQEKHTSKKEDNLARKRRKTVIGILTGFVEKPCEEYAIGSAINELYEKCREEINSILIQYEREESLRKEKVLKRDKEIQEQIARGEDEAEKSFKKIVEKWSTSLKIEMPVEDFYYFLCNKREECESILKEKDCTLHEMNTYIRSKTKKYELLLQRNKNEIIEMCRLIDDLVLRMTKMTFEEIRILSNERFLITNDSFRPYEIQFYQLIDNLKERFNENVMDTLQKTELYESILAWKKLDVKVAYAEISDTLINELHALEQARKKFNLQCLKDQEQFDYNIKVVSMKIEEGKILQSKRKRLITFLNTRLINQIQELKAVNNRGEEQNEKLKIRYKNLIKQIFILKSRAEVFKKRNQKCFEETWVVLEKEAKNLTYDILKTFRKVEENILMRTWISPQFSHLENIGPLPTSVQKDAKKTRIKKNNTIKSQTQTEILEDPSNIQTLLHRICNETEFFVDNKFLRILADHPQNARVLLSLDTIFRTLDIDTEHSFAHLQQIILRDCDPSTVTSKIIADSFKEFFKSLQVKSGTEVDPMVACEQNPRRDVAKDAAYWNSYTDIVTSEQENIMRGLVQIFCSLNDMLTYRMKAVEKRRFLQRENQLLTSIYNEMNKS